VAVLTALTLSAAEDATAGAWRVLKEALRVRGPSSVIALELLGTIDDPTSRALLDEALKSKDAAWHAAAGLTPPLCIHYLADLRRAARDPNADYSVPLSAGINTAFLAAIARAGTSEAAQALAEIADEAGFPTAGYVLPQLDSMGPVAEPQLIRLARSGQSPSVRAASIGALRRMKTAGALDAFRAGLHDSDYSVRRIAALALASLGNDEGSRQLEATANDADVNFRNAALAALAALGHADAFDKLKALLASSDEKTRYGAVSAIAATGSPRLKAFAYQMKLDRQPAFAIMLADKLLDPKDPRDKTVLQELMTTGEERSRVLAAEHLLGTTSAGPAESVIKRALTSPDWTMRVFALEVASRHHQLRPELANRLSDSDPRVQAAALSAIAELHQKDRFKDVTSYLTNEEAPSVSLAAARTLVALDPAAAKGVFEKVLKSRAEEALSIWTSYIRIHSAAMLLAIEARSQPR